MLVVLLFTPGFGTGLIAVIENTSSLWRMADVYFDLSAAATMLHRGRSALAGRAVV